MVEEIREKIRNGAKIVIDETYATWRADKTLARILPDWSRSGVGMLVQEGAVSINGGVVEKGSYRLKVGDVLQVDPEKMKKIHESTSFAESVQSFTYTGNVSAVVPEDIPLDIVHEDEDVLVVDKPAGMVVHPAYANTSGTLANAVAGYFERKGIPLFRRIGLVHRLDKDVSGLVIVAKHEHSLRILSEQFSSEGVTSEHVDLRMKARKYYWGIVTPLHGSSFEIEGLERVGDERIVEGYIWRSRNDRKKSIFEEGTVDVVGGGEKKRYALSILKVEKKLKKDRMLLKIRIITGRTHQIRAQLSNLGIPIEGDVLYGGRSVGKGGVHLRCVQMEYIPIGVYEKLYNKDNLNTTRNPVDGRIIEGNDSDYNVIERLIIP